MEKYHEFSFNHPYNKNHSRVVRVFRDKETLHWELTQGKMTLVDLEDFSTIEPFLWRAQKDRKGYYVLSGRNEGVTSMHVLLGGHSPHQVDHINRDGLDNRKVNLRFATKEQQMFNRVLVRKGESCRYRGVQLRNDRGLYRTVVRRLGDTRSTNLCHSVCPITAAEKWDEFMYEEYKNNNPLEGYESRGIYSAPTINFIHFNFPERLGL